MRLVGAALLVAATGLLGARAGLWYVQRARHLAQFALALHVLETDIAFGALPLPEALRRAGEAVGGPVGAVFAAAAQRLVADPGCSGPDAWRGAVDRRGGRLALTEGDREALRAAGVRLGASDADDQVRYLRAARHTLRVRAEQAQAEGDVGARLWRYVGVSAGLAAALLLY